LCSDIFRGELTRIAKPLDSGGLSKLLDAATQVGWQNGCTKICHKVSMVTTHASHCRKIRVKSKVSSNA
jgi:hypothetical protein